MQPIINWIKMNPLLAGLLFILVAGGIWMIGGTIWTAAQVAYYERQNAAIEKQNADLMKDINQKNTELIGSRIAIENKDKELIEINALLQGMRESVAKDKNGLNNAVARADAIIGDSSPMSRAELRAKLCDLYKDNPPAGCK